MVITLNITSSVNPPRFGHGVAGKTEFVGKIKKSPCSHNCFRQKAVEISNLFREGLGLPLIKSGNHHGLGDSKLRILPFIGTPNMITTMDTMFTTITTKVTRGMLIIVYLSLYSCLVE